MRLIESMAEALDRFDKEHEVALIECGEEIGRFPTIADAKQHLQDTYGEGRPLEWKRIQDEKGRRLAHEGFEIRTVRKP